jgi:parvulin-like peptidyl-prolyl isomerase
MKKTPLLLLLTLTLNVGGVCAADDTVVARVGTRDIRVGDLQPILASLDVRERAALAENPAALNQVVRTLIIQQLLVQKATDEGYDKRPTVQQMLEQARLNALAEGFLASSTRVPEGFPSDEEVAAFYEANKASLLLPRRFELAQIFLAVPEGAGEVDEIQAQRRASDLRRRLDAPRADFAEIARAESDEPESAARGGQIGLLPENMIQPEVREKIAGLSVGAITEPIRLPGGWHIVKVLDIKEPQPATLEEIKPLLADRLRAQREQLNREAFLNNLLQENPVAINELALSDLLRGPAGN